MRWPNGSTTRPNISSPYGPREAPTAGASSFHRGCDFTGCDPVRAVADGVVRVVGTPSGWSAGGRQVWIQHDGYFSRSMHMGSFAVSEGQHVSMGQILGSQDTTGTATGSHCHLEICLGTLNYNNNAIDPVPFIQARLGGNVPADVGGSGDTAQLQLNLNTLGYPLDVDGDYGPATKAAVTAFQRDNGLEQDGIAGPKTNAKISDVMKALQSLLVKIGYNITVDGAAGPQTVGSVKDFQSKNGLTVDGIVGPQTEAKLNEKGSQETGSNSIPNDRSNVDIQRFLQNAKLYTGALDGIYGPGTTAAVKAYQASVGLTADGIWGPLTDAKAFPKAPSAFIPIDVDGKWGKATTTALQANLGFTGADIDGDLGPKTIKALQTAIGLTGSDVDGVMGPKTSKYLQSSLGVTIDGQVGPGTINALQTLLNRNGKLQYVPFKDTDTTAPVKYPKPAKPTYPKAVRWDHSSNCTPRGDKDKVQLAIIHHNGADPIPTADQTWTRFMSPNDRSVSANVQVNADGSVFEPVPSDGFRAWTTGIVDMQAITAETQNSSVGPQWAISPEAHEALAQWVAWGASRYHFPIQKGEVVLVNGVNVVKTPGVIGHRDTPAGKSTGTICPGPSMNLDLIMARAKQIQAEANNPPVDPPVEPPVTDLKALRAAWLAFLASHESENKAIANVQTELDKLPA